MPAEIKHPATAPARCVVMGVSGCGKSVVGQRLAQRLGVPFIEGDAYHPAANIDKMSAGTPLNDDDRAAWLQRLQAEIAAHRDKGEGFVLSCSALKRRYRDLLRAADPDLPFVHLAGSRDLIAHRMQARAGHYMPLSLLDSQFRDLEPLEDDERGLRIDIDQDPEQVIATILQALQPPA